MDNGVNGSNAFGDLNDWYEEVERLLQEINRSRTSNINRNSNSRSRRQDENTNNVNMLRELLCLYNSNMRDYQENMKMIIQTIFLMVNNSQNANVNVPPRANNQDRNYTRNTRTNLDNLLYYLVNPSVNRRTTTPINTFSENVVVRPSQDQIESATVNYEYSTEDQHYNNSCPITLEEFQNGDEVCRIMHCGHTFRRTAIENWFREHVRCPVCRYDIREYNAENAQESNIRQQNSRSERVNTAYNNARNTLTDSLIGIISDYYQDISQNLVYTFEIPIVYNDTSRNYLR